MNKGIVTFGLIFFSSLAAGQSWVSGPSFDRTAIDEDNDTRKIELTISVDTSSYSERKVLKDQLLKGALNFEGCSYLQKTEKVVEKKIKTEVVESDCDLTLAKRGSYGSQEVFHRCQVIVEFSCEKNDDSRRLRNEDLNLTKACTTLRNLEVCY